MREKIPFLTQVASASFIGGVPAETGSFKGRTKRSLDDVNEPFLSGAEEMAASIESIKKEIEEIRRPSGTQTNPARSCKDLYLCNKGKENGMKRNGLRNVFL